MAGKEPDVGPTSKTVAANVKRQREAQNLTYTQLSERLLAVANWSINAVGIRRIEAAERRVTPDDLMALAVAFGISPISLLMPGMPLRADGGGTKPGEEVEVTGLKERVKAGELWNWLKAPQAPPSWIPVSRPLWLANALPKWEWDRWSKDSDE